MIPIPKMAVTSIRVVCAVLIVLCSLQFISPTTAQELDPNQDLAAMALNPLDLDAAGLAGYGINTGQFADASTYAAQLATQTGRGADTLAELLDANGFVTAYSLELDQAKVLGDPAQGLTQVATSSIIEFEDEEGAAAAYAGIADVASIPGATDLSDQLESGFAVQASVAPSAGYAPVNGVIAVRQEGNRIGIVVVAPTTGVETVAPLLDRLIEKISILTLDGGPDLGRRVLRLVGPSVALDRGYYNIGYGASLRLVTQFDEEFGRFEERYAGAINGYSEVQVVEVGDGTRLQIRTVIVEFETDDEASTWLQGAVERQGQLTSPEEIVVDDELQTLGDESNSLTYPLASGNGVRQGTIRVGSIVAVIDIVSVESSNSPGRILLDELGALQADCLANFCEGQEPPTSITTGIVATPRVEEPTDDSTPVAVTETPVVEETAAPTEVTGVDATPETTEAAPTAEPTTDPALPDADGNATIADDLYGIQITYNTLQWQPAGKAVEGTRSNFDLTNGVSTVSFVGDTKYAGDPKACLDDALVYLETVKGATGIEEILDASGNSTVVLTEQAAQGLYRFNDSSGALVATFLYCTTLTPGETTFLAIGIAPGTEITTEFPIMVELISTAQVTR